MVHIHTRVMYLSLMNKSPGSMSSGTRGLGLRFTLFPFFGYKGSPEPSLLANTISTKCLYGPYRRI